MTRRTHLLRAALVVGAIVIASLAVQLVLIRWAYLPELRVLQGYGIDTAPGAPLAARLRPRVMLALLAPLLVAGAGSVALVAFIARKRSQELVLALGRVASGDFDASLPRASDPDWQVAVDAFDAMRRELRQTLQRLAHADSQRRRLFSDLAHELATPTSSILALVEALDRDGGTPDDATRRHRLLGALDRETARLSRFISDVRELATLDDPDISIDMQRVDVAEIAQRVVCRMRSLAGPGAAQVEVEATPAGALADEARLDQVLTNLLRNAQRHTPSAGRIRVQVGPVQGTVRLAVDDSGPGVPATLLPQLGERLLRADASRSRDTGGNGVGLSIVAAIVARHGGRAVYSRSDLGGLRAEVVIPAEGPAASA